MIHSGGLLRSADDQTVQVLLEICMSYPWIFRFGGKAASILAEGVWWYDLKLYWQSLTSIKSWRVCFLAASRKSSHWEENATPTFSNTFPFCTQPGWVEEQSTVLATAGVRSEGEIWSPTPINKNGAISKASLIFWTYWKGHTREPRLVSLTVPSLFFMHRQFILFNIWSVVRSACVSHRPSTQEGKHTGSTYLTYFPWKGAKAQCKQAGTHLKIRITSWLAVKQEIEGQFTLEICLQKLKE